MKVYVKWFFCVEVGGGAGETWSGAGESRACLEVVFFWVKYLWLSVSLSLCAPLIVGSCVVWLYSLFGGRNCCKCLHNVFESCT